MCACVQHHRNRSVFVQCTIILWGTSIHRHVQM
uniref:Male reproductive-related protein n=1 Tax=Macrobrachium rosenbergii TaxID=79674 RepID=B8LG43_MACRS|nr:male reproductive-related protein [Macrobrachium rosenbergii]